MKPIHLRSELKQIYREPIMILLFLVPIIIPIVFKLLLIFGAPLLTKWIAFDINQYYHYILATTLLLTPFLLGLVIGFMILDDKDGHISELMMITPMGYSGYLLNRMLILIVSTILYSIFAYAVLGIYKIDILTLLYISILLSLYSMIISLIFAKIAPDKVKGLAYAKGLNVLLLFAFSPLLKLDWVNVLSMAVPTYWIPLLLMDFSIFNIIGGGMIHLLWLITLIKISKNIK